VKTVKLSGPEAFESFYGEAYGERWSQLKASLLSPTQHVALIPPKKIPPIDWRPDTYFPHVFWPAENNGDQSIAEQAQAYFLDYASLFAANALEVKPGDAVLDLCAAPGGKSLYLSYALQGMGSLQCNDRSDQRRVRLKKVLADFVPHDWQSSVMVTGHDGKLFGLKRPEAFDKILLDAPCSSERHVLKSPEHLKNWKPARTKQMAKDQGSLICSAFDALKPGGRMVYSTCSLSRLENDGLMDWFEKKRKGQFCFVPMELVLGEKTEYGHIFLPDKTGHGPLYLSVLQKVSHV